MADRHDGATRLDGPDRYDVIVVGARVAGAATAMLLARRGLRVLVLDRARSGSDTLSTHAFMRGGVLQLGRWGLLERIVAAGTPAIRQTRFHYGTDTTTVSIKPAAGVEALYAPRRTLLDTVLVDAAMSAGAQVRFGMSVTDLLRDRQGRVAGVRARDRSGGTLEATAWLTIGADGARSTVAGLVDAPVLRRGTSSAATIYGYWPGLQVTGYEWFYRPGSSAGMIPTNDGEVCVFAASSTERFRREYTGDLRAGYLRLLGEATSGTFGGVDPGLAPQRLHAFLGRPGLVRRPWGHGWALVGDAGHFVDPLSTHGMTDALRDAHLLTLAVESVLRGEPESSALAAYQARRDRLAGALFTIADEIAGYAWSGPALRHLLLRLSSAMSDEVEAILSLGTDAVAH